MTFAHYRVNNGRTFFKNCPSQYAATNPFSVASFKSALELYLEDQKQESAGRQWQKKPLVQKLTALADKFEQSAPGSAEKRLAGVALLEALKEAEATLQSWLFSEPTKGQLMMKSWKEALVLVHPELVPGDVELQPVVHHPTAA